MRRCFEYLPKGMVRKDDYPGLPEELKEYNYYVADAGRCITCIPECLLEEAEEYGDLDLFEVSVPVRYVLEKGYRMHKGHVICDAPYKSGMGLVIEGDYEEW